MKTEVKIDMRHPSVNGTVSQFLDVKIAAIIFIVLMFFNAQKMNFSIN